MTSSHPSVPSSSEQRVILARHGETLLNVQRRFRGRADPPLGDRGLEQARRLGDALVRMKPTRVISSPRQRAQQTASAIASSCRLSFVIEPKLDDVDYGAWTGLTTAEVAARWPDDYAVFLDAPERVRFPDGESIAALVDRAWEALLSARDAEHVAVLVTHDIVIRGLLCRVLDAPLATMHRLRIDVASSTGLRATADGTSVEWMNETCHLRVDENERIP